MARLATAEGLNVLGLLVPSLVLLYLLAMVPQRAVCTAKASSLYLLYPNSAGSLCLSSTATTLTAGPTAQWRLDQLRMAQQIAHLKSSPLSRLSLGISLLVWESGPMLTWLCRIWKDKYNPENRKNGKK